MSYICHMKQIIVLTTVLAMAMACAQQDPEKSEENVSPSTSSSMKMAEESELASLMKSIHKDAKTWRAQLEDGMLVEADADVYAALTESTPTNENVKGPVFEGMSMNYQEKLNAFLAASEIDLARDQYNNLVTACVQCHQNYCTGPIPTIKKLYLSEK